MIIKSKNQPTLIIRDQNYNFEFSSEVSKQNKKYYSEIICITNCTDESHLHEWLYWHINIIKIEHLVLIDNTPDGKLEIIAKKFNVSYKNITGILSQCDIYNDYVNNSEAEWVLPIDDDEYLYMDIYMKRCCKAAFSVQKDADSGFFLCEKLSRPSHYRWTIF